MPVNFNGDLAIDNFSLTSLPIADDPTISIAATANASEAEPTNGGFRISRTGSTTNQLRVLYGVTGSTTFGSDYASFGEPANIIADSDLVYRYTTIAAGSAFVDIPVAPIDDQLVEGNEDVFLSLKSLGAAGLYTVGTGIAGITIVDNDVPTNPTVLIAATNPNAPEFAPPYFFISPPPGMFRIIRTGDTTSAVTVDYTVGGTANGVDYDQLTGTATISAGASFTQIKVKPIDDTIVEGNEDVTLTLSAAPTGYALGTATANVTIVDNDFLPTVSISAIDPNAAETNSDPGVFRISRTGATTNALSVYYNVTGSASIGGGDYNATLPGLFPSPEDAPRFISGSLTIPAGSTFVDIPVVPIDDKLVEGDEDVIVTLGESGGGLSPAIYTLGTAIATVKIADNDVPTSPTILVAATNPNATEFEVSPLFLPFFLPPPGMFRIIRTGDATSAVTVNYTVGGTATNGVDYYNLTGTATIAAGASFAEIQVNPIDDTIVEGNEDVILTLTAAPTGYALGTATAKVTLVDNDFAPPRTDFNGDGKSDIFWRNDVDGRVVIWTMDGTTVSNASQTAPTSSVDPSWTTAGTGDFNGNGKSDILWRNSTTGNVAVWTMNGSSVTASTLTSTPTLASSWTTAGVADFNGDGKSDILWRNDDDRVVLWTMDGSSVVSFAATSTPTLAASWKAAGTGDFNGDGKADILWRNDDGSVALWQMNGTGVTSIATSTPSLDSSWKINGTADFNGDGKTDILWRNTTSGNVAVWQMNGAAVVSSTSTSTPSLDSSWQVAGTADFSGDGKADILWRKDSGAVAMWEMNGASVVSSTLTSTQPLTGWQVAAPIF